jgi:predicted glycogen debranching enzyme
MIPLQRERATPCSQADARSLVPGDLEREWLVTNGLGGFASGTIGGTLTRRYHGLLFAARTPPVGRTLLCPKIDAEVRYDGGVYALANDRWRSGALVPDGAQRLISFALDGSIPVWTYACGDALLERRVWMEHDANRTYATFALRAARGSLQLRLRAFANHRDLHALTRAGAWRMDVAAAAGGVRVVPYAGAATIWIRADGATCAAEHTWYFDFEYAQERARGLDDVEDHLLVATFDATLRAGETIAVAVADAELEPFDASAALERRRDRDRALGAVAADAPPWVRRLTLAADQFVVRRPLHDDPEARSVIAGYHWFGDWGRDTAIALPGLALVTGRHDIARTILRTFARFIDGGMLPNYFPDGGEAAEYNTVDAALWYVEAVRRYYAVTQDRATLAELFSALTAIVRAYTDGTRYAIAVDPGDGLLRAGEAGVQLTWMDAKAGDWVVTPRIGKPVEVNALWINALRACAAFARELGADPQPFTTAAARAEASFERFWNPATQSCFDVIDGPGGDDATLRPNAIFAVALPIDVLDAPRRRAIVEVCASRLWTPAGLRSLDPRDSRYRGRYAGNGFERDGAYHQGTVWTWLAGPFAQAHLRAYGDPEAAELLLGVTGSRATAAVGTLSEIADGDAPFEPRGAVAQAWSVATILDAWHTIRATRRSR